MSYRQKIVGNTFYWRALYICLLQNLSAFSVFVCGLVCGSITMITRNYVHRSSPKCSVGEGSDHLQLIKFWPSCVSGNGVCDGAKIFGSAFSQRAVFASHLRFFHFYSIKVVNIECSLKITTDFTVDYI